jgi:hypothetical protein
VVETTGEILDYPTWMTFTTVAIRNATMQSPAAAAPITDHEVKRSSGRSIGRLYVKKNSKAAAASDKIAVIQNIAIGNRSE